MLADQARRALWLLSLPCLAIVACSDLERATVTAPEDALLQASRPGGGERVALDLGTLGGTNTMALDINDRGQVVGWSHDEEGRQRPFIWDARAGIRDLGTLGGGEGVAMALNYRGTVVGWSRNAEGGVQATRWDSAGEPQALHPLHENGAGAASFATAINSSGEITGADGGVMARWDRHGQVEIVCSAALGFPTDIDDSGRIVGVASVGFYWKEGEASEYSGFVWTPGDRDCQRIKDETFLAHDVFAINNRGMIIGLGGEWREHPDFFDRSGEVVLATFEMPLVYDLRFGFDFDADFPAKPRDINTRGTVVGDGIEAINEGGDRVGGPYLWTTRPRSFGANLGMIVEVEPGWTAGFETTPRDVSVSRSTCPESIEHLVRIGAIPQCPLGSASRE